jgi:hypothetical protein
MSQVLIPQKKDDTQMLMTLGGAVAGGFAGDPMTGAQAGSMLGGVVAEDQAKQSMNPQYSASQGGPSQSSAMARRLETIQTSPVQQLSQAQAALKAQPPDVQKQYMDTVNQALILAQRDQRRGQA